MTIGRNWTNSVLWSWTGRASFSESLSYCEEFHGALIAEEPNADEPRRLLMILKLSDLQRSLDYSLATTHGQYRVYIIIGHYCAEAG